MRKFLGSIMLLIVVGACKKADDPRLQFTEVGFTLHLPPAMQHALDSLAPGFRAVRMTSFRTGLEQAATVGAGDMPALFAIIGDFDGDGTLDAVVEGATPGDTALHVIAIMNGVKPKALEVMQFPVYDADAVGVYLSHPTGGRKGAFEVVNYPDASMLYRYRAGRFEGTNIGN